MALGADLGNAKAVAGYNRAATGPAQLTGDGRLPLHGNHGWAGLKFDRTILGQVFTLVLRVEPLQIKILIIKVTRRQPPAKHITAPDQHRRNTGDRRPDHPAAFQLKPGQHPHTGCGQAKMRVIGQQGAATGRAPARGSKCV